MTRAEIQKKLNIKSRTTFIKYLKQGKIKRVSPVVEPDYEIIDPKLLERIKNVLQSL